MSEEGREGVRGEEGGRGKEVTMRQSKECCLDRSDCPNTMRVLLDLQCYLVCTYVWQ